MALSATDSRRMSIGSVPRSVIFGILAVLAGVAVAAIAINRFIDAERGRDLRAWQARLGIVANSRAAAVDAWLETQYATLTDLAENAALQIYVSRLQPDGQGQPDDVSEVEGVFLRNLLETAAVRGGFSGRAVGPEVDANVERVGVAGLALLDAKGRAVAFSAQMPPLQGVLADALPTLPKGRRGLIDIHLGVAGTPTMGFAVPVFAVQGDNAASDQVGTIVGIREVAKELYPLLKQPGNTDRTGEGLLLRQAGGLAEYLSPLGDGGAALKLSLALDTPNLASAFGLANPGGFASKHDYRNNPVLLVSRKIAGAPWTLIYKIDEAEALAETAARNASFMIGGGLLAALAIAIIVATWHWATSVRVARSLVQVREASERFENLAKFLSVLSDTQPTEVFAVTVDGDYTFANRRLAENSGMEQAEIVGKNMINVIGPTKTEAYAKVNAEVMESFEPRFKTYTFDGADGTRTYRVSHVPLRGDRDHPPAVLQVVDDITEFLQDSTRRAVAMRQFVKVLAMLIDHNDPYSVLHSVFVVEVAAAIAAEMNLTEAEAETIDTAANAVNLGKVFVPRKILLKYGALTDEERQSVEAAQATVGSLLEGIDFGVPVRQVLSQVWERWDGQGRPLGLAGEDIMIEARVVKAAHSFVGMISPRAHRDAIPFAEATEMMIAGADKRFDRRVVMALTHYLENRGGRELLQRLVDLDDRDIRAQLSVFRSIPD